jgi:translation elongation factor EF-Tu-like GTPase
MPAARQPEFEATIRIFSTEEGGRITPPHNRIRWDFNYADELPQVGIYMIHPVFVNGSGDALPDGVPMPIGVDLHAQMTIIIEQMRAFHRERLSVGTRFFCCEGSRRCAAGVVTKITGLGLAAET